MQEFLTKEEVLAIEVFCKNKVAFDAVKKVLLQHIYSQGVITAGQKHNPLKNRALALVGADVNNEQLGSHLRALWEGVNALEGGYAELEKIKSKKVEEKVSPYNEAI
jgi:hypothetical protein